MSQKTIQDTKNNALNDGFKRGGKIYILIKYGFELKKKFFVLLHIAN